MIITLTPNPSLDLLFSAERLVWDDANRTPPPRRRPGGQGINVIRAVRALDPAASALAIAPLGGPVGAELREMLDADGVPLRVVPIEGETRIFVGARAADTGRALLLNPRGPVVGGAEAEALITAVELALHELVEPGEPPGQPWVACCGSLLPGLGTGFYAEVGRRVRDQGGRFVPDCDGAPLAAAAELADLLVPNEMEAGRLVGRALDGPEDAAAAARSLLERGPATVVLTLGRRGAVAATGAGSWWARPEPPPELDAALAEGSAVGAGDAFLAGFLIERERAGEGEGEEAAVPRALALAVAAGSATLLGRGAELVAAAAVETLVPHVRVERLTG